MTVADILTFQHGLFWYMNQVSPLPWIDLVSVEATDRLYVMLYGRREIVTNGLTFTESDVQMLAENIYAINLDKWQRTFKIYVADLDIYDYDITETETKTNTGTVQNTGTTGNNDTVTNTVSPFDSSTTVEFANDNKSVRENTASTDTTLTNDLLQVRNFQKKGNTSGNMVDRWSKAISSLKLNFLRDVVFRDINDMITYSIFNLEV